MERRKKEKRRRRESKRSENRALGVRSFRFLSLFQAFAMEKNGCRELEDFPGE